jgi:integrase
MGRKLGASKRQRIAADGSRRFDVRWREWINGSVRQFSKTFTSNQEAESFLRSCLAKKGAVRSIVSIMDEELRKPGECLVILPDLVALAKSTSYARSGYSENIRRCLTRLFTHFQWRWTTDIPDDAFQQIKAFFGPHRKPTISTTCQTLKYFLRWAMDRYLINERLLHKKGFGHKKQSYYIWTDEEVEMILAALMAPHAQCDCEPGKKFTNDTKRKLSEAMLAAARHSLVPIIWIQMHWALRPTEASLVRVRDWCPRTRTLTLPKEITKNGLERYMVVDETSAEIIAHMIIGKTSNDLIFTTRFGRRWYTRNQAKYFRSLLRSLGLKGSLYSCRHYAATTLMEQYQGEWRKVMRITGHQSMEQLVTYLLEKKNRTSSVPVAYEQRYANLWRHAHGSIKALISSEAPARTPASTSSGDPMGNVPVANGHPTDLTRTHLIAKLLSQQYSQGNTQGEAPDEMSGTDDLIPLT